MTTDRKTVKMGQHVGAGNADVPASTEVGSVDTLPPGQSSKSPAFSFYAKEWLAATLSWALDARGAYATLMAYQWDAGSVPGDDMAALGRVLGVSSTRARLIWAVVSSKFERGDDGHWRNERLEQERQKQADRRAALAANGAKGADAKWKRGHSKKVASEMAPPSNPPSQNDGLAFTSSFSSSTPDPSKNDGSGANARARGLIISPLEFHRIHGSHVTKFCDWHCLPQSVFDAFVKLVIAAGAPEDEAQHAVMNWAQSVREAWRGRIPGDDIFDFWRNEWKATHGTNKPLGGTVQGDGLSGLRDAVKHG